MFQIRWLLIFSAAVFVDRVSNSALAVAQTLDIPLIAGVESYQWGTPRHSVMEDRGFPLGWAQSASGIEITYAADFEGEPTRLTLFFEQNRGLSGARFTFILADRARCEEVFEKVAAGISARYRTIVPRIRRTDGGSLDPCELAAGGDDLPSVSGKTPAAVIGGSNRSMEWVDPRSGARIELMLQGLSIRLQFDRGDS